MQGNLFIICLKNQPDVLGYCLCFNVYVSCLQIYCTLIPGFVICSFPVYSSIVCVCFSSPFLAAGTPGCGDWCWRHGRVQLSGQVCPCTSVLLVRQRRSA